MGLDLIVEGCAKPGREQEWRQLLECSFAEKQVSDVEVARFREISTPGYVLGHHELGVMPPQTIGYCRYEKRKRPKKSLQC
jgi:hypothetical protein